MRIQEAIYHYLQKGDVLYHPGLEEHSFYQLEGGLLTLKHSWGIRPNVKLSLEEIMRDDWMAKPLELALKDLT